jgi:pyroglutamyl-peptidase
LLESTVLGREYGLSNQDRVILLHFGANSGSHRFALENQAVNEATFRCPDELGWKPQRVPIMSSDGSILHARQVYFNRYFLKSLCISLKFHLENLYLASCC